MKILQVCNKIPYPPRDGGSLAMHQLSDSLDKLGHSVRVLAMNTHKQGFSESDWDEAYRKRFKPEAVFIDTRVKVMDALLNLFSDKSYNVERFYSAEFEAVLKRILLSEKFDIVQLESIYVSPYAPLVRKHSGAKLVLRAHNIEHRIWERLADGEKNGLKKKYLRLLSERLKAYEIGCLNDYDAIAAITPSDAAFFRAQGFSKPVAHIPFGIEVHPVRKAEVDPLSLFFIGAMDWKPNQESVSWVLDTLWDKLLAAHPGLNFHIAGRNMPRWMRELNRKQVHIHPEVPDAELFMADKSILLAPYFSGGGMRVKFIEAMAQKKVVVTNAIGAEGIDGRDGEHFLLAESPAGLISVVSRCLNDPAFAEYIGANARSRVSEKYDSRRVAERLGELYKSLR